MSNKAKVARLVPETPDNSSSDDENEPEGEELQVRSDSLEFPLIKVGNGSSY